MLRMLTWLTTLSLDAPLVAVAWQALLAESFGRALGWERRALVFACVWLGYTADRWLDVRSRDAESSARHDWHRQRAREVGAAWVATLLAALALAWHSLDAAEWMAGLALAAASVVYAGAAQAQGGARAEPFLKTIGVGALVAAAAALYSVRWRAVDGQTALTLAALVALFSLNCLALRRWERPDRAPPSRVEIGSAAAVALGALGLFGSGPQRPAGVAVLLSLLALGAIEARRSRVGEELSRTLADVALMSPFLILPFL